MEQSILEPGKTVIGEKDLRYEGIFYHCTVYYGNILDPVINGYPKRLGKEEYDKMLEDFLQSKEGKKYKMPTKKEARDSVINLINVEAEITKEKRKQETAEKEAKEKVRLEQQEKNRREEFDLRQQEVRAQEKANELSKTNIETLNLKIKRQKLAIIAIVVINVLMLILNGLLITGILKI